MSPDKCSEWWAVTRERRARPAEEHVVEEHCGGRGRFCFVLFCFLRRKLEHDLLTGRNELVEGEGVGSYESVCV